jgi:hypothetical protein
VFHQEQYKLSQITQNERPGVILSLPIFSNGGAKSNNIKRNGLMPYDRAENRIRVLRATILRSTTELHCKIRWLELTVRIDADGLVFSPFFTNQSKFSYN